MKLKSRCCKKYCRKAKACSACPIFAVLGKKKRRRLLEKAHRERKKAA